MPQRNVASNFTFEQQRVEINELAADFWSHKGTVDTAAGTYLLKDGSNAFTGGTLNVPNAFTIASNAGAGTVTINANLQVQGTTTTLNSTTLEIADKNIVLAKGSANDAAADGAGLTIDSATDKTFNFVDADSAFVSSIGLKAVGNITGAAGIFSGAFLDSASYGSPNLLISGTDSTLTLMGDGSTNSTSYTGIKFRVAGNSTGDYTKAGIFSRRESGYNDLSLIFALDTVADATSVSISDEKMRITSAGKVVIGDTNSDSLFGVYRGSHQVAEFTNTNADATGAELTLRKDSASPADNDSLGLINFTGDNDAGQKTLYSYIQAKSVDVSDTTEDGNIGFFTRGGGTLGERIQIHSDGQVTIGNDHAGAGGWDGNLVVATTTGGRISVGDTGSGERFDIAANGDINLYSYLNGDGINFHTTDGNGTFSRLKITSAGSTQFWGTRNGSLQASDSDNLQIYTKSSNADGDRGSGITFYNHDSNGYEMGGTIQVAKENDAVDNTSSYMRFGTRSNGGDVVETLRIDSNGYVGIKLANPHSYYAKDLVVGCIDQGGITLKAAANTNTQYLMFADGTSGNEAYRGYIGYQHASTGIGEHLQIAAGGLANVTLDANGKLAVNGDVHDSKGNLRNLPRNEKTAAYTAVTADKGKFLSVNSNVTFDQSATWNTGDVITVYNYGSSTLTIVSGTGVLIHYTDGSTASTGNRILASRGVCTLLCVEGNNNTFVISGTLT